MNQFFSVTCHRSVIFFFERYIFVSLARFDDSGVASLSSQPHSKIASNKARVKSPRKSPKRGAGATDKLIDVEGDDDADDGDDGDEDDGENEEDVLYRRRGGGEDEDLILLQNNNNISMEKWDVTRPATCLQSFK